MRLCLVLVSAFSIGLGGGQGEQRLTNGSPGTGSANAPALPWNDYAPDMHVPIDAAAAAKECASVQGDCDTADANNAATLERTGHNNAALMAYIDAALRAAGCY